VRMTGMVMDGIESDAALALTAHGNGNGIWTMYAGRPSGLSRSSSGDRDSWEPVAIEGVESAFVTSLSANIAASGQSLVLAGTNGGILRSTDAAESWLMSPLGSPPPLVTALDGWHSGSGSGWILAGTLEDGVYRSGDRGATWAAANIGLLDMSVHSLCCAVQRNGAATALAGTETGVFLSTNGGRSWRDTGFHTDGVPVQTMAWLPGVELAVAGTAGAGVCLSEDNGRTWSWTEGALRNQDVVLVTFVERPGQQPAILAVLSTSMQISLDLGRSWTQGDFAPDEGDSIVSAVPLNNELPELIVAIGLTSGPVRIVPVLSSVARIVDAS
ncbi:MAG TPA: hypothetical protein VD767_07920, partial [Thermomicrobiales bacterium]|nr:hypothetical protein [Thermomicrobiales bacterium]